MGNWEFWLELHGAVAPGKVLCWFYLLFWDKLRYMLLDKIIRHLRSVRWLEFSQCYNLQSLLRLALSIGFFCTLIKGSICIRKLSCKAGWLSRFRFIPNDQKSQFLSLQSRLVWEMFSCGYQSKLSILAKWLKDKQCQRKRSKNVLTEVTFKNTMLFNSINNSFPPSYLA